MTSTYRQPKRRPKPTAAARRKAQAGEAKSAKQTGELVTFRLSPDTVRWLRHWAKRSKNSLSGYAQEIIDCVRLHGKVVHSQYDIVEADRRDGGYTPTDYQGHIFFRRAQALEDRGVGFDKTTRSSPVAAKATPAPKKK